MKECPAYSIIMPIYNVEKYVDEAIASILSQDYEDFELIIVNDGSKDTSLSIAQKYASHDARIIIIDQCNQGLGAARNVGVQSARGDYIYFFDGDDILEPDALSTCIDHIQRDGFDLIVFSGGVFPSLPELKVKYRCYQKPDLLTSMNGQELYSILDKYGAYSPSACLYIFAKKLWIDHDLRFDEGVLHEDHAFTARVFCYSRKTISLKKKFFRRRVRNNSITTSPYTVSNIHGYIQAAVSIGKLKKDELISSKTCCMLNKRQFALLKIGAHIAEDIGEVEFFSDRVRQKICILELLRIDPLLIFYTRANHLYMSLRILRWSFLKRYQRYKKVNDFGKN